MSQGGSGSSAWAGWVQQWVSLPDVPGNPLASGFEERSSGRVFSSLGWLFWSTDGLHGLAKLTAPFLCTANPGLSTPFKLDQLWAADVFPVAQQPKAQQNSCSVELALAALYIRAVASSM